LGRLTGNKSYYGLAVTIGFDPAGGFGFHTPTNFTDHDNGLRVRVVHEQFNRLLRGRTNDWVAPNANSGTLTQSGFRQLIYSFIGQGARL
jgi:hypothetical protein